MNAKTPPPQVSVRLMLDVLGGRPKGMTGEEHVAGIICAVINTVMEQTVLFLDEHPNVTEIYNKSELRHYIMNGAIVAATEQLCAAWKFSHQPEEIGSFVKMMFDEFEYRGAEPNVGDVGHA